VLIVKRAKNGEISDDFRIWIANISGTDQDITPNRVTSFNVAWTLEIN